MGVQEHRTVPELLTDLISQVTSLFRTETRLARGELNEKIAQAGSGIGMIAAGAVVLIPALVILLQAAAAALIDQSFQPYVATLIVGGAAPFRWAHACAHRHETTQDEKAYPTQDHRAAVERRSLCSQPGKVTFDGKHP